MTMITPSYLGETIEYSSLHACRSTLEDPTVAVVGSEELHPVLFGLEPLARILGLPTIPITPTLPWLGLAGLIPLPSKWFIAFGKPIDVAGFGPDRANDTRLVLELTEEVRGWVQETVNQLRPRRRTIFF